MKIYPAKKDILYLIFTYAVICLIMFFLQRYLMYAPDKSHDISFQWIKIYKDNQVIALQDKENKIFSETVIVFHGNGGNANARNYYKNIFPTKNLIIAEYPGYGFRSNEKVDKDRIIKSAQEIINVIKKSYSSITLIGESLGSAVASEMAVNNNINKLILVTPYTSIQDVVQYKFWYLPTRFLIKDDFDNTEQLKKFKGKVAFIVADSDTIVPTKFGIKLFDDYKGEKIKIIIKNSNHNEFVDKITPNQIVTINQFIDRQ